MNDLKFPASLRRLKIKLEEYRGSKTKVSRIPDKFWNKASKYAKTFGVSSISRYLKLNYSSLKDLTYNNPDRKANSTPFAEVHIKSAEIKGINTKIEIKNLSGASLKIDTNQTENPQVLSFIKKFIEL